jgi:hypothetical protein
MTRIITKGVREIYVAVYGCKITNWKSRVAYVNMLSEIKDGLIQEAFFKTGANFSL